jgi:hypothetical protein
MKHPNRKNKLKHTTKGKIKSRFYLIKDEIIEKKMPCNMSTKAKIKAVKCKDGRILIYKINCKSAILLI